MSTPPAKMVSYSASFEDVILQRALQEVPVGCYVDVGASQPLLDSNTAAFYQKGWRGICVEPLQYLNVEWAQSRPDDLLINGVVGANSGETTFYCYTQATQISTCSVDIIEYWKSEGRRHDYEITVPMFTLNEILEEFLNDRTIHLLSIDTEGYEKEVLKGFDLKKYQPWIIVMEATLPGSRGVRTCGLWENDVLAAGYSMVYDDSVNRFYLSDKKPELRQHFSYPPSAWDDFIPIRQKIAQEKYEEIEKINKSLISEIEALKKMLDS